MEEQTGEPESSEAERRADGQAGADEPLLTCSSSRGETKCGQDCGPELSATSSQGQTEMGTQQSSESKQASVKQGKLVEEQNRGTSLEDQEGGPVRGGSGVGTEVQPTNEEHVKSKVVVPTIFRREILRLGHDVVASHMGRRKTDGCTTSFFYWPGITGDVGSVYKNHKVW